MKDYEILLFYKYTFIENPTKLAHEQRVLQERLDIKGRTLIAQEGINATLEGTRENLAEYLEVFLSDPRFAGTHIKRSIGTGQAFPKLVVKVKDEIVASEFACNLDPNQITGRRLSPTELHDWINSNKEFYIVDMRNAYEQDIGYFKNAVNIAMDNFRDLPKFLNSISHLKNKTVVTVCTGGVRCEKASGYLLQNGFGDVWQLDGGIVSYMEKFPNEDFVGKLYVFDSRITMGFFTDDPKHQVVGKCSVCTAPCERFTNCANDDCHRQTIAHEPCQNQLGQNFLCPQGCKQKTRQTAPIT